MHKLPLSLCLIVKNEAKNLERCLDGISKLANEILVLDNGSDDGTQEVAQVLGAQVFSNEWDEDFSAARNLLLEKAQNDWILWIDADEHYPQPLLDEIEEKIKSGTDFAGFYFPRRNYYLGRWLKYGGNYPDYQLKLFRKSSSGGFLGRVHEKVKLDGRTGKMKNYCEHFPYPTIKDYMKKFHYYTDLDAKKLKDSGVNISVINTLKWLVLKPFGRVFKRYILKGGFLNGFPGIFAVFFDGAGYIVRYLKLWELYNKDNL
ncbi:glycosyltransferase family 2 protein [candidate division KSB1 bacterium]